MKRIMFICCLMCFFNNICLSKSNLPKDVDKTNHWTLTSTYYHPVKSQCDDNPLVTADGTKISLNKLKSKKQRLCALSRDLLKLGFKYGDIIYIEELKTYYIVADTMNKRFTRRIDILVHPSHKMEYSKLTIRKVNKKR